MNVVLEGADGGGKSTLAATLADALGMRLQQGSGPPRGPGEVEARLREYNAMTGTVFDRHPAVSQVVYGTIRNDSRSAEFDRLVSEFYLTPSLFIYCRSTTPEHHVVKPGENPAHIETLTKKYDLLVSMYDGWALGHARLIYRIGDDVAATIAAARVLASVPA